MAIELNAAPGAYLDFAGLSRLRADADTAQGAEAAARQFESLFAHQLVKSMRDATIKGGLFDSKQTEFYQDLFDQQMSLELTRGAGLGLRAALERELGHADPGPGRPGADPAGPDPATVLRHAQVSRQAADILSSDG